MQIVLKKARENLTKVSDVWQMKEREEKRKRGREKGGQEGGTEGASEGGRTEGRAEERRELHISENIQIKLLFIYLKIFQWLSKH